MRRLLPFALAGAAVVALAVVLLSGGDDYTIKAKFEGVDNLRVNNAVKVAGVPAGSVKEIELDDQDRAVVTMSIKEEAAPLGRDTRAVVRPVNLLGEKYVELQPGDAPQSLADGEAIPLARTDQALELDDIFNSVDMSVRARLRLIINEFGIAATGRGKDFGETLESMPRSLDEAEELLSSVASSTRALESAITSGDRVLRPISDQRRDLGDLIASAERTLRTVAERRDQLGSTLATAPAFLRNARTTLDELRSTATNLRPTARRLTATAEPLQRTLSLLPAFRESAQGTLRTAERVAPALGRLGRQGAAPVKRLRPTVQRLATFAQDSGPLLATLGPEGGALKGILRFMVNWAGVTKNRDGLGQIFRIRFGIDEELVQTAIDHFLHEAENPAKKRSREPATPAPVADPAPAPRAPEPDTKKVPDVREPLKDLTKSLGGTLRKPLDRLDQDLGKTLDNVGGLTKGLGLNKSGGEQPRGGGETSRLLDYLVGP